MWNELGIRVAGKLTEMGIPSHDLLVRSAGISNNVNEGDFFNGQWLPLFMIDKLLGSDNIF